MTVTVTDPWAPTDPLGQALHLLRMSGAFYCRSELTAPWGFALPALPGYLWFHLATSGEAWLDTGEAEPEVVRPGEMVLVPHGTGHLLRSDGHAPAPDILDLERELISDRYELMRLGGGGTPTTLLCGAVRFEHPAAHNLIAGLPHAIHIDASRAPRTARLRSTLELMADEARELQPGGEAVITRLADIIVIQAIRWWIENDPSARTGWLGALRDPQVGGAIALIQRDPARAWTVESLADEVSTSRSAFAARFTQLVGEPVMQYVTRWRMHVAVMALADDGATIAELAHRLGYRSEAAFARAFKRVIGDSPGAIRRSPAPLDLIPGAGGSGTGAALRGIT